MHTMPDPEWNELYIAEGKCSESQRDTLQVVTLKFAEAVCCDPSRMIYKTCRWTLLK